MKPGKYLWTPLGAPSGRRVAIYVSLDVVDALLQDVMRGFGAVPKRGAEVGGILMGAAVSKKGSLTVDIESYELVPIEYKRGPSYLLSDADVQGLRDAVSRAAANGSKPVGFFRSHTRDAVGLVAEDRALLDKLFPGPDQIVLLIRPFATRVSMAGYYVRESGVFPEGPPSLEFPFRRKDLAGDEAPPAAPAIAEDRPIVRQTNPTPPSPSLQLVPVAAPPPPRFQPPPPNAAEPEPEPEPESLLERARSRWVWLPFSFIFLLLGVLLGFQAALTLRTPPAPSNPFAVSLNAKRDGKNLTVRWDRQAAAIQAAVTGTLLIEDGSLSPKAVPLSHSELQTGSVVYVPNNKRVKLGLELRFNDRDSILERLEWKE